MKTIYLDNAATTPVDERVARRILEVSIQMSGNPSSVHSAGRKSRVEIETARAVVAAAVGAHSSEIVFTSGGTECNNMALIGTAMASISRGRHIITTQAEHPSVLNSLQFLQKQGFETDFLPLNPDGIPDLNELKSLLRKDTILISMMLANNETGAVFPVKIVRETIGDHPALIHTDAVQAFGRIQFNIKELNCDLLSLSAHKIYGPKGTGALFIRNGVRIDPLILGGSQEAGRRAGTENTAGIAGFAEAVRLLGKSVDEIIRITELRDYFEQKILALNPEVIVAAGSVERLCSHSNLYFPDVPGDSLLMNLDIAGVCASTGSACSSGAIEPSHVLKAMGRSDEQAAGHIRFSFGRFNTREEAKAAAKTVCEVYGKLKAGITEYARR